MDRNNLIGKNNDLPWHYPEDLKYFKNKTLNHTVLMGTKTFKSIVNRLGKPLPKRKNLVASKKGYTYPGVETVNDLTDYLKKEHEEEVFVIGGKSIFEAVLPYADKLYITHIKKAYEGDTYLDLNLDDFELVSEEEKDELTFAVYERKEQK